jgi:mono/diheme cytochrome c family protein
MRALLALVMLFAPLLLPGSARAETPTLTLTLGGEPQRFTAAQLLARPDAATLEVPDDAAYHRPMTYRAVPLLALLGEHLDAYDTLEARATDGFVAQVPLSLVKKGANGGSVAWIAVEDPSAPWPSLPEKDVSAGPFYMVWVHPERSNIGGEQWPYQLAGLTAVESPAHRWPQMAVAADLPEDAPARRGEAVFVEQCLPCHRMKDAGAADVGPDLGQPMSPTRYFTPEGLRRLIRDPKSVRTWPQQAMPGFDAAKLSDADLDALIAYLAYMARERAP